MLSKTFGGTTGNRKHYWVCEGSFALLWDHGLKLISLKQREWPCPTIHCSSKVTYYIFHRIPSFPSYEALFWVDFIKKFY